MTFRPNNSLILAVASLLVAGMLEAQVESPFAKVEREKRQLQLQLDSLRKSYGAVLESEAAKTKSLKQIKEHLALFGKDFFEGGDTRLLNAATDYQVVKEEYETLELASSDLLVFLKEYLRTAIAADPDARAAVESRIRTLEAALGLRKLPKRKIDQGTIQQARVVTVDSESGAIVVNAGQESELAVGMRFRIERSGTHIGDAMVAATRPNVSGLLLQSLTNPDAPVKPGDLAKIILNSDPTN